MVMMTSMLTMEDLEWGRVTKEQAEGRLKRKEDAKDCRTEDDHLFDSTGECTKCGAHRSPYRVG